MKEINELLGELSDEGLKKVIFRIYDDIEKELKSKPASTRHHHLEEGGLYRHTKEMMNLALDIFDKYPNTYDCTRDEVIVAGFVHDFNKLDLYVPAPEWKKLKYGQKFDKVNRTWINESARTVRLCAEYGLILNDMVLNAVCLHHGGWVPDINSKFGFVESQHFTNLATILHCADLLSAFVFGRKIKGGP